MGMLESLRSSMRLPGLRNRLLFTALMFVVLRVGGMRSSLRVIRVHRTGARARGVRHVEGSG